MTDAEIALSEKFVEIINMISSEFGLGTSSELSEKDLEFICNEAEEVIEDWEEAVHLNPSFNPKNEMQHLLKQYVDLAEVVMDERDSKLSDEDIDPSL